jgi:hypothetical protein
MSPGSFPSHGILPPIVNKIPSTNRMIPAIMSKLPIDLMAKSYIPPDQRVQDGFISWIDEPVPTDGLAPLPLFMINESLVMMIPSTEVV